jgi:soluble lytic murein transglycosylase-like protein
MRRGCEWDDVLRRMLCPLIFLGVLVFSLLCVPPLSFSDIYRFKDERGVWHFSNIKSDPRFRVFMRTPGYNKSAKQYIHDYEAVIKKASKKFRVEPSLIKAVIKAESDFDGTAVSDKGAQGLMQLMPETANEMDVGNPFNPEENILGGTRYLSLMLERFKNNLHLALAAYNAGPENVEEYRGIPPFVETKNFIERVLRYYSQFGSGGM